LRKEWKIAVDLVRNPDRHPGSFERSEVVETP
jgi:hypothetical protein